MTSKKTVKPRKDIQNLETIVGDRSNETNYHLDKKTHWNLVISG